MMKRKRLVAWALVVFFNLNILMPLDVLAKGGGGFGGGGGRSFSSGRSFSGGSFSGSSKTFSSGASSAPAPSPGRTFSGGSTPSVSPSQPSVKTPSVAVSSTPNKGIDAGAQAARVKEQSQKDFKAAQTAKNPVATPASSSNAASNGAARSDYQAQRIRDLKRDLRDARYENRELRSRQAFSTYPVSGYPCCYSDPFGNIFFWMWLMDRPRAERDVWVYHHRDEMDPARYNELKHGDPDIERRLAALETQGVRRNPAYTPSGLDRDLMYSDEHIQKVRAEMRQDAQKAHSSSFWSWGLWILLAFLIAGLVWLVFFKKWRTS